MPSDLHLLEKSTKCRYIYQSHGCYGCYGSYSHACKLECVHFSNDIHNVLVYAYLVMASNLQVHPLLFTFAVGMNEAVRCFGCVLMCQVHPRKNCEINNCSYVLFIFSIHLLSPPQRNNLTFPKHYCIFFSVTNLFLRDSVLYQKNI